MDKRFPRSVVSEQALGKLTLGLCLALVLWSGPSFAQEATLDAISRQATQLEAELGKFNDNTPDAADVMVKLVDLYHGDGRVFGLVRIGNRFVSTHPTDPRHKDVMLKMIDGLQAMSRNKDMIVACRQFLTRYPTAPECGDIEIRLANTLAMETDKEAAADAFAAIWNRHKNTPLGRQAAARRRTLHIDGKSTSSDRSGAGRTATGRDQRHVRTEHGYPQHGFVGPHQQMGRIEPGGGKVAAEESHPGS